MDPTFLSGATWLISNPKAKGGRRVRRQLEGRFPETWERLRHFDLGSLPGISGDSRAPDSRPARVLALGGDGTVRAVADWMVERRFDAPLGIIPAGTGNNLAGGLDLPRDPYRAFELALSVDAPVRAMDAIRITHGETGESTLCLQSAALGFPASIASQYDRLRRHAWFRALARPFGHTVYRSLSLFGLIRQGSREKRGESAMPIELTHGESTMRLPLIAFFIGNERSLGGDFYPCPHASVDDGQLDCCWVSSSSFSRYLKIFRAFASGAQLTEPEVGYLQTSDPVRIQLEAPLPVLIDGDLPWNAQSIELRVEPRCVRILGFGKRSR